MCGIAGIVHFSGQQADISSTLNLMTDTLARRGPDDAGFWYGENVALGHRRLVVVDPEGGRQPMTARKRDDIYTLVYNGELYNTEELRQELAAKGYSFEGWSDTEVLLKSYMEWGDKCLAKLNGIYAFAIWDGTRKRLFLARDRIGVKPLFYTQSADSFIFASEIKAILAHPAVSARIDREGLAEIFVLGPARTPGQGIFKGLAELKPGHCMYVDQEGSRIKPYWSLVSHTHEEDLEQTITRVRELVYAAVERQLVSDVPLCVLLSGGLDSSTISAIATEVCQSEGKELIRSFSVDYVENERYFQESDFQPNADTPWIERVSKFLGTNHASFFIDTPELVEALFPALVARDLPGMTDIDSSLLLFCRWIKKQATVGLSGECADEVFGGYPWFYQSLRGDQTCFPWSPHLDLRTQIMSPELIDLIHPADYVAQRCQEALAEVPRCQGDQPGEAQMRELFYLNLTRWMPTLLDRKDRMSMAAGVELRVPFCDHHLVEYVWNIPWAMKNYRGREKGLLREALTGILPEDVLWRKKSPYPKTHHPDYIKAVSHLTLAMLEDANAPILPLIKCQYVEELASTINSSTSIPWFGQLMNAPQILAYLLQVNYWLRQYRVTIM